jgi:hypothetical protein
MIPEMQANQAAVETTVRHRRVALANRRRIVT